MATTTFTTTPAEDARLQAWATAAQFATPKALIITLVRVGLQNFEQQQNAQTFNAGYTPINPT